MAFLLLLSVFTIAELNLTFVFAVPRLGVQAGPPGLPAAHRTVLPPAEHLQQSEGGSSEPRRGAGCVWGMYEA